MTKHRILYAEDDEQLGSLTSKMLKEIGYDVSWAKDGIEAENLINDKPFHLCVVDIMMPRRDGYSFTELLRKKGFKIPIIFLSARVLPEDVVKGFESGANDYIRKPYNISELNVRIKNLLGYQSVPNNRETIIFGQFTFRYATYELSINNNTYSLTPRLAHILHKMLNSADYLLIKKDALIDIWGNDDFFSGRSFDVFISKLRKILAEDSSLKVVNIRSVGYRLIEKSYT